MAKKSKIENLESLDVNDRIGNLPRFFLNKSKVTKDEINMLDVLLHHQPIKLPSGYKLNSWQKKFNKKIELEYKLMEQAGGDQARYMSLTHSRKRKPLLILYVLISLSILGLSIAGVVLASIDFAHNIYNAKSICFMVFGCIGLSPIVICPVLCLIKSVLKARKYKQIQRAITALELFNDKSSKPNLSQLKNLAKEIKVPVQVLIDLVNLDNK